MTPMERARVIADRLGERDAALAPLGHGTEHQTFATGPYVIRLVGTPSDASKEAVTREAALLDRLQTKLPIAVPHPTLIAADLGGLAYRRLPGQPLLDVRLPDRSRLLDDLGVLLRATTDLDPGSLGSLVGPDPYPLDDWRDEVVEEALRHADSLSPSERRSIEAFGRRPVPAPPHSEVFCHNDLGAEHLLVDVASGHLLGVLDWSDAAMTDPCRDLGRLRRDLGAEAVEIVVRAARLPAPLADPERIGFHARVSTLEDLTYGFVTGDRRYVDAARRALHELFEPRG